MRRFIYQPQVKAYIFNTAQNRVIDISDDIVSGSIVRRLNAVSQATLQLQNKNGKYTGGIGSGVPYKKNPDGIYFNPMDPIRIYLGRVKLMPALTGYLDSAPLFQIYPDIVEIKASCTLKLLQYTYFDPGLVFMSQWMSQFGFVYNFATGTVNDPNFSLGNLDFNGGMGKILFRALHDIGRWKAEMIHIKKIPESFVKEIAHVMLEDLREVDERILETTSIIRNLLGDKDVSAASSYGTDGSGDTSGSGGGSPQVSCNYTECDIVNAINTAFEANGIPGKLGVAVADLESTLNPNAANDSGHLGLFQNGIYQGRASVPDAAKSLWQSNKNANPLPGLCEVYPISLQINQAADWFLRYKPSDYDGSDVSLSKWGMAAQGVTLSNNPLYANLPNFLTEAVNKINSCKTQGNVGGGDLCNFHCDRTYDTRVSGPTDGLMVLNDWIVSQGGKSGDPAINSGDHVDHSDHYCGMALDIGDGKDPASLIKTWNIIWPYRQYFKTLIWAPTDGSVQNQSPGTPGGYSCGAGPFHTNDADHTNHIHISYVGTSEQWRNIIGGKRSQQSSSSNASGSGTDPQSSAVEYNPDTLISVARGEIGVTESPPGSNTGPRINQYLASVNINPNPLDPNANRWCAAFTYWCFNTIGAGHLVPKSGSAQAWETWAKDQDVWVDSGESPELGDVVSIENDGNPEDSDHIGIVTSVSGKDFTYVSGNTFNPKDGLIDTVAEEKGNTSSSNVRGFIRPGLNPNAIGSAGSNIAGTGGIKGSVRRSGGNRLDPNAAVTPKIASELATRTGFFLQQLQTTDSSLANLLTGERALSNDIPLLEWVREITASSMRSFCSGPSGEFFAFFPDHFGWFGRTPYFKINPIEITNLQINVTDENLITHVYGIGPLMGVTQLDIFDNLVSAVASVSHRAAFDRFIRTKGDLAVAEDPSTFVNSKFNWYKFLQKYGGRPLNEEFNNIRHPVLLWMATWRSFLDHWAERFYCDATFTFMPELFPGGIVNIGDYVQMFVQEVTHEFSLEDGFSTSAELIATTLLPALPNEASGSGSEKSQ